MVRSGLKPILRELGISAENVGLHAFRHGLATELAESEPITVLQTQMRHADVRTTLKVTTLTLFRSHPACDSMEAHCETVELEQMSRLGAERRSNVLKGKKVGRGGGDRTHDLRLKRPLLYH